MQIFRGIRHSSLLSSQNPPREPVDLISISLLINLWTNSEIVSGVQEREMSLIYGSKEDVARTQHQSIVLTIYLPCHTWHSWRREPSCKTGGQTEGKNYLLRGQVVSRVRSVSKKYCPLTPAWPPKRGSHYLSPHLGWENVWWGKKQECFLCVFFFGTVDGVAKEQKSCGRNVCSKTIWFTGMEGPQNSL